MAMATSQSGWPKHTICDRWMFLVPPHLAPMLMGNIPMTAIIATKTKPPATPLVTQVILWH